MTTTTSRKANLEAKISSICGFAIEITIRGEREFTLSAEGQRDFGKAVKFLSLGGHAAEVETVYDSECDLSCCFFNVTL